MSHFSGYAAVWWRCFEQSHPAIRSWAALRADFKAEFELVDEAKIFEQRLQECKQTGSLQTYVEEFMAICARLPDLSDGFKRRSFARRA